MDEQLRSGAGDLDVEPSLHLEVAEKLTGVELDLATTDAQRIAAWGRQRDRLKPIRIDMGGRVVAGLSKSTALAQVVDAELVAEIKLLELGAK